MNKNEMPKYIGRDTLTVAECMQKIDANTSGILFLVDRDDRLTGCITDGDIRRFLLAGGKMTDMAAGAANHNPKLAYDREEAGTLYHKKNYVAIPIIDSGRKLIDIYRGTGSEKRNKVPIDLPVVINAGPPQAPHSRGRASHHRTHHARIPGIQLLGIPYHCQL